jgi:xanthosine utilization system XapX-like protein
MAFLMMLSSAQLVVGFMFMLLYVGIPPMVTAVLGLLVSFGHMMGYIPGDHLEKQVKLVRF